MYGIKQLRAIRSYWFRYKQFLVTTRQNWNDTNDEYNSSDNNAQYKDSRWFLIFKLQEYLYSYPIYEIIDSRKISRRHLLNAW